MTKATPIVICRTKTNQRVLWSIFILIMGVCFSCRGNDNPYPYTFFSTRNYEGTLVEDLAKHVKKNDTIAIIEFLRKNPTVSIDTKDKFFGSSLLMFAIYNGQYEAFHCLLHHGANPNFVADYRKETPLYLAAGYCGPQYESNPIFCKELLEHGADPNYGYVIHRAAGSELEYVKVLVEYGANYNTKYYGRSPADDAIILCQPEIAVFLIIEKKALLYNPPFWKNWDGTGNSQFASLKKKIVNYLKSHPEQLMYRMANKNGESLTRGQ